MAKSPASESGYPGWISLGMLFPSVVIIQWVFYLTRQWGYAPYRGWGIAISLSLYVAILAVIFSVDYALSRAGLSKSIRSALWAAAFIGPYTGLAAWNTWAHPVWAQVAGVGGTVAAFAFVYLVVRRSYGV